MGKTPRKSNAPRPQRARTPNQAPGASSVSVSLLAALLIAAGIATYANSLWGVFVYDDRNSIVINPHIFLNQQKFDEAAAHYRRFLENTPDNPLIHNNLGLALTSHPDEAIVHFRRAIELGPDSAEPHFNLGLALSVTGHIAEGQQHFREAVRLKPDMRAAVDDVMNTVLKPAARSSASRP